jgi:hypothetical protein
VEERVSASIVGLIPRKLDTYWKSWIKTHNQIDKHISRVYLSMRIILGALMSTNIPPAFTITRIET